MKVLITGGAGYMGSTLAPMLLAQGHQLRVIDSLMYGGAPLLGCVAHPEFEFLPIDLRDSEPVASAVRGMDAIVHLAAIVGDPACAKNPELARQVNLGASLQLLETAQREGIERFVFASTCSNYGRIPDPEQLVDEDSELRPVSLYAETKVAVEAALLDSSPGAATAPTILRFATLFGVGPRMRFDLTVNEFTLELLTKGKLSVYGEQFWRPYIHVRDAARAIATVLKTSADQTGWQVYNVGDTNENYQKKQLVNLILDKLDGKPEIDYVQRDEDPRDYRVSFAKIQRDLDFQITRTVGDGIVEVIDAVNTGIISDPENPRYRN